VEGEPSGFQLTQGGTTYPATSGSLTDYSITMNWDVNTEMPTSGSLTVGGSFTTLSSSAVAPLLTGTLKSFGFPDDSGDNFQFLFTPTGGSLESYYPQLVGVDLHPNGLDTSALGVAKFSADFNNGNEDTGQMGNADTFATAVPLPAVFPVCTVLLGGLAIYSRRKKLAA
jgi:hypothetical protein